MEKTFVEMVKVYFEFLVMDYDFEMLSAAESPRNYFWEGRVVYATKATYVCVECVRGEFPSFDIGRTKDVSVVGNSKRKYLLPFHLIYEYMITTDDEKKAIISFVDQKHMKNNIYQEKNISHEISFVDDREKKGGS